MRKSFDWLVRSGVPRGHAEQPEANPIEPAIGQEARHGHEDTRVLTDRIADVRLAGGECMMDRAR